MSDGATTIITNLQTQLKLIKTTSGYSNNIGDVLKDIVLAEDTNYPAAFIVLPEAELEALAGNNEQAKEKLNIYFIVKEETTPMADMLSMRDDILKNLAANPTLSGVCDRLERHKVRVATEIYPNGTPPGFNPPFAAYVIECTADWRYSRTTGTKI